MAGMLRRLLSRTMPLRLRKELRLRLRRTTTGLRERFPDLATVGLRKGAIVIDAGANVGSFSESVLAYQPRVHLHVFEPIPAALETLQARLARFRRVTFNGVALGAARGEGDFHVSRMQEASSFLPLGQTLVDQLSAIDFSTLETI